MPPPSSAAQETKELIELVRQSDPAVVDELVASDLTVAEVQRVLQDLLAEEVPIRDIVRILDVLGERARVTRDPVDLTEAVRVALGPSISAGNADGNGVLHAITLEPVLEQGLLGSLQVGAQGPDFALDPSMLHQLALMVRAEVIKVEQRGASPVIVTARPLRRPLRRLLALTEVKAPVLSPDELGPQIRVESAGVVTLETADDPTVVPMRAAADGQPPPGFWDRLAALGSSSPLAAGPGEATVGVIGPLAAALGVVRRLQRDAGAGCEVVVLTARAELVCEPGWTLVRNGARLAEAVHRPGPAIVVIDVASPVAPGAGPGAAVPAWLPPLVARLRRAGMTRVHLAVEGDPDDVALAGAAEALGQPLVLDLAAPVGPDRLVSLLERWVPVASVRGRALTPELELAARISCGRG